MKNRITASHLRTLDQETILNQLGSLKAELAALRITQKISSKKINRTIRTARKSVARTLTVIHEKTRDAIKKKFEGKKYKPLDLREKKTRALRRKLTKEESSRKTPKEMRRLRLTKMKKYALKA